MLESLCQGAPTGNALLHPDRISLRPLHIAEQGSRFVFHRIDIPSHCDVVAQLHHIVVKGLILRRGTSHVQDVHQSGMIPGDRFILQDSLELALKAPLILKVVVPDSLDRPQRTSHPPGKPYLSIGASADLPQNLMIWNRRLRTNLILLHAS